MWVELWGGTEGGREWRNEKNVKVKYTYYEI